MDREYPERYAEYKRLNIPKHTENRWRKEKFNELHSEIMRSPDNNMLWSLHARLYNLFEDLNTPEELIKMLEATKYIRDKVPLNDRVIVAETINGRAGREERSGLIFMAYDSGDIPAAKEFAKLSLSFSSYTDKGKWNFWNKKNDRCQRSAQLCKGIMIELGL